MNEPKLRFKADDGNRFPEWEEKTVGDITIELQDYEPFSSGYPLMTSSRTGLMMQNEFRSKSGTDDGTAIFSIVPRGVATYRHMSDDDIFILISTIWLIKDLLVKSIRYLILRIIIIFIYL